MIVLYNNRLAIQILEPGCSYSRSRFDWSGIVQQVTLDGEHTFCSQEATRDHPGTEGVGLVDEFGIHTAVGYDHLDVGDWFPKIGIGFLERFDPDSYNFFADYPIKPSPICVDTEGACKVSFLQQSEVINGWGWQLRKTYKINGPELRIDYLLENCGEKPIQTEQYNHNFMAINGEVVGPDYQLETSFPLDFAFTSGGIQVDSSKLKLTEIPPQDIYALQPNCSDLQNVSWCLTHSPSGHGLRVSERYQLCKYAVWGKRHVISPEFFIWIDLQPGQTQSWQR